MSAVLTIEKAVHDLGYESVNEYAKAKLQEEFQAEIVKKKAEITTFELKYGMNYSDFCRRFHEIENVELFEKEDDSMDWEFALEIVKQYENKLLALS